MPAFQLPSAGIRALSHVLTVVVLAVAAMLVHALPAAANVTSTPRVVTLSLDGGHCLDGGVLPELAFQPCDGSGLQQWVVAGNPADLGATATIMSPSRYSGGGFAWLCVRPSSTGPVANVCNAPFWWNVSEFAGAVGTVRDPGSGRYLSNAAGGSSPPNRRP